MQWPAASGEKSQVVCPLDAPLVCVVGPTASGKTALAQRIAERLNGCVLSADSMQIYRGMDIGTGKIAPADRTVPYYGLDVAAPGSAYSASLFQEYGRGVVLRAYEQGCRPIVCGGTGFYVRALVDSYDFPAGEQVGNPVRDAYNARIAECGCGAVWAELNQRDPASAALINAHDAKRVVRAFELLSEGTSYAEQHAKLHAIGVHFPVTMIGLQVDPEILRHRIDARVDQMVEDGLVDEVRSLLSEGLRDALTANQAIGYKEIVQALDGAISLDEAISQIKFATHRYAKRQRTWFRKDKRITWICADRDNGEELLCRALEIVDTDEKRYGKGCA
ncbi:tRNA (adenosine(37)-N6)-dimethylallyltransferase MiaA [Denitrobacterium detoxificans]|jgi:tRNA dimethylallyltransferase|uniref:tRNA (adenosine(37)-N6)-dimethylallyltransferase MiaA n=1 Tax=Denitrobacterium detoxificans TaxID=79604 RepID=UPI0026EF0206|nr:tRNA (adenosine(37)-N6)-dimethylallyltransferase MiaA [Denitrobacterium detoxificans]MBE6466112.1 tRNA (adenosine(37)-N6)-dimethylallyltransferase MiaA [Denitrobacterium detoxificans]